jgi:peptide/nickel transport system ATP-binding protein
MPLLSVENLSIRFAGRAAADDVHAVRGLSFSLEAGQCVAIVGESGSGKSATARALVGLAGPNALVEADKLSLGSQDLRSLDARAWRSVRGRQIGFVLQDALVSLDPLRTIGAEVGETIREHRLRPRPGIKPRVLELLSSVGIPDPAQRHDQYAHQLSGGLRQRALIASAISGEPGIVIADEPTTALDVIVQAQILRLLSELKQQGRGLLLISHDLAVVSRLADFIIVLRRGEVVEEGTPEQVFKHPRADYTKALLAAIPSGRTRGHALSGESPAPAARASSLAQTTEVITARSLTKNFGHRRVVNNVSFEIRKGETVGLVGASGSGKTTLARIILGLERPDSGDVLLDGAPWSKLPEKRRRPLRPNVQLVAQDPLGSFDPRHRVIDIIGEALEIVAFPQAGRRGEILRVLQSVGLDETHLLRRPRELSGGQRQRVAIARALATRPEVLVCDEPVSALDVSTQAQVLDLLASLKRELGLTMLFVSHDLGVIQHVSDRVLVMNEGEIVESGRPDIVLEQPQHPYTRALVEALPRLP